MANKVKIDYSQFRASGVYTLEFDASQNVILTSQTIRLVVGEIVLRVITQRWGFSGNWTIFADLSSINRFICIVHIIAAP
jgi:hypothetical protein